MTQAAMDWDLSSFFPTFAGPEMDQFKRDLKRDLTALAERAASLGGLSEVNGDAWEEVFVAHEELFARATHLEAYLDCVSAADALNPDCGREVAAFSLLSAQGDKLDVELASALGAASDAVFAAFAARPALADAAHTLRRQRERAQRTMSREKEALAADLGVDGLHAWGRMYNTISSKLEFEMRFPDGRVEQLPMSQRRALMSNADRRVRQAAFAGGNAAWAQVGDAVAASLNGISGTRLTLNRHRGVDHFLDIALFQSACSRKTLEAMLEACFANVELPRRILRLKARLQKTPGVAWYDLAAPLPLPDQDMTWDQAKDLVANSFSQAYPLLGRYLKSMYDNHWIDWAPRSGKRPGAFCTESLVTREARVYMTFNNTLADARTLAHEAGHAFHCHVMRDIRPYSQRYPMTLAESASTFGEMLLTEGVLSTPGMTDSQRASILNQEVSQGAIFLLDIPVRYSFEKKLYEQRSSGELSVDRLCQLMAETQREILGDVLEEGGEDPYFWASKLHFYITEITFYNFPYTFGFLLSRGLYAMFKEQGAEFLPRYEQFLRLTGSDTAEGVARRTLGRDLESPEFWTDAINTLEEPLARFEEVLPRVLPEENA